MSPESPQHGPAHKANSETQTVILIFLFPFPALASLGERERAFPRSCLSRREREREIRVFDSKHDDDDEFMCAVVAGFSLMIGLGISAFIASILCSGAFFHNAKEVF
uniref:Transmembrane protein n=1 Tax=Quercus lobata TaxID=97700 RepID=A0A7N2R1J0_QUELO